MTFISIAEFTPFVQPYAPSAPTAALYAAIRRAAIDYCERTLCWRGVVEIEPFGDSEPMCAPANAAICKVESAFYDGCKLEPAIYSDLLPETDVPGTRPLRFSQMNPDTIRLDPAPPNGGGVLRLAMLLKPAFNAMELPEFLLRHYAETIGHGAVYRLKITPGQSYSDPAGAVFHLSKFAETTDINSSANVRGQHRARPRVRARYL